MLAVGLIAADRRPRCCCRRSIRVGARRFRSRGWWPRRASPGVAKDITKTASKSAIKATSEGGAGQLFRWVAWFTGSKNAMKGFGFFAGGALLQLAGFKPALWLMAAMLAVVLVNVLLSLPSRAGQGKGVEVVSASCSRRSRAINLLAAARIFLFGSRDVWFVVGLPVFLYAKGWKYMEVAGFLASWTIGYGLVQAIAPSVVRRSADGLSREIPEARLWGTVLTVDSGGARAAAGDRGCRSAPACWSLIGLSVFGFVFAVISSLHSYLILAYAGSKKAAEDVGFYYAANAARAAVRHRAVGGFGAIWRIAGLPVGLGRDARNLPRPDFYAPGRFSAARGACRRLRPGCRHISNFFEVRVDGWPAHTHFEDRRTIQR